MFKRNKLKAEAEAKRLQLEEEYRKAEERNKEAEKELKERMTKYKDIMKQFTLHTIDDLIVGEEGFWLRLSGHKPWANMVDKVKVVTKGTTINGDDSVGKFVDLRIEGWNNTFRYWETDSIYFCRTEDEVRALVNTYYSDRLKKYVEEETKKLDKEYVECMDALKNWTWSATNNESEDKQHE